MCLPYKIFNASPLYKKGRILLLLHTSGHCSVRRLTPQISFAPYSAVNSVIRSNYLDAWPTAPDTTDFWRYGFCMEVDGEGTLVEGNTCISTGSTKGWGWSLAGPQNLAVAIGGRDVIIRDNVICDGPVSIGYESPHPELLGHPA
jgi:hypothetical protein